MIGLIFLYNNSYISLTFSFIMDKHQNPIRSRYEFYLDMSGTLKKSTNDIYIGAILMPDLYKSAFREKFYREFPSLKAFNKKGSKLLPAKLKKVIEYLDGNNVKMCCVLLKRHVITDIKKELIKRMSTARKIPQKNVNLRFFEERVAASVYVETLTKHSRRGYPYNCFSCPETQFDIQQSFVAIDRICYAQGLHFRFAAIPRRTEHMIKFADFVASAGRKLDKTVFTNLKNFEFKEYVPNYEHLDRAFNISRHTETTNFAENVPTTPAAIVPIENSETENTNI